MTMTESRFAQQPVFSHDENTAHNLAVNCEMALDAGSEKMGQAASDPVNWVSYLQAAVVDFARAEAYADALLMLTRKKEWGDVRADAARRLSEARMALGRAR